MRRCRVLASSRFDTRFNRDHTPHVGTPHKVPGRAIQ